MNNIYQEAAEFIKIHLQLFELSYVQTYRQTNHTHTDQKYNSQ